MKRAAGAPVAAMAKVHSWQVNFAEHRCYIYIFVLD